MTDYTQVTEFTPKDSLAVNDPEKLVVGSELDAEFAAIATAIASKMDATEAGGANGVAELNANAKVPADQMWASMSAPAIVTSAVTYDCATSHSFYTVLTENITVNAPDNPQSGQTIKIMLKQDATGSRTVAWNAIFCWPGAATPTITATASRADIVTATYNATLAKWLCSIEQNYTV
jgi:hypothetical protein